MNVLSLLLVFFAAAPALAIKPVIKCAAELIQETHHIPTTKATRGFSLDIDDNILFLPTKIVLFKKSDESEVKISTTEFAEVRSTIGISGKYVDYEFRDDIKTGSLKYFGDEMDPNINNFLNDVISVVNNSAPEKWQGPSWKAFVYSMKFKSIADRTTLITARLHSPVTILAGLKFLQQKGYINFVPRVENIFPVAYPQLKVRFPSLNLGLVSAKNPSPAKAAIMMSILDEIQTKKIQPDAPMIVDREGTGKAQLHTWGFSDDDYGNFSKALTVISSEVENNPDRWNRIKITIFYTGKNGKVPPQEIVVKSNGSYRSRSTEEAGFSALMLD